MLVIGLTGGTGSGKSTVSQITRELGAWVIDADIVARQVVKKGQKALDEIASYFGKDILLETGELNRKKLGSIVFADKEKLQKLNQITHKYITEQIKIQIEKQSNEWDNIIIDAAVLIESGLYKLCDEVWVVTAEKQERLKRIMERDGLSYQDAQNRIESQMKEEDMKKYASAVIYNTKNIEFIRMQVMVLMQEINKMECVDR